MYLDTYFIYKNYENCENYNINNYSKDNKETTYLYEDRNLYYL